MKHIPLLFVCVTIGGCAPNITELMVEAKKCVDHSTNELGVIGATPEQRTECWAAYNKKTEELFKISEKKRKERELNEYYQALCAGTGRPPVIESWGRNDKRFLGCGIRGW